LPTSNPQYDHVAVIVGVHYGQRKNPKKQGLHGLETTAPIRCKMVGKSLKEKRNENHSKKESKRGLLTE